MESPLTSPLLSARLPPLAAFPGFSLAGNGLKRDASLRGRASLPSKDDKKKFNRTGQSMEDARGGLINQVGGREMEKGDGAFRMWGGREQNK